MERFEDERGTIEDLFGGESVHVTQVATNEGAIRGNHRHDHTEQWTREAHLRRTPERWFSIQPGRPTLGRP
jgi:hypothetical protein